MGFLKKITKKATKAVKKVGRALDKSGITKGLVGVAGLVAAPITGGASLVASAGVTSLMNKSGAKEAIVDMAQAASNAGFVDTSKVASTIAKIDTNVASSAEAVQIISKQVQETAKNLDLPKPALNNASVSIKVGNDTIKVATNETFVQKVKGYFNTALDFVKKNKIYFIGGFIVVALFFIFRKRRTKIFGKKRTIGVL